MVRNIFEQNRDHHTGYLLVVVTSCDDLRKTRISYLGPRNPSPRPPAVASTSRPAQPSSPTLASFSVPRSAVAWSYRHQQEEQVSWEMRRFSRLAPWGCCTVAGELSVSTNYYGTEGTGALKQPKAQGVHTGEDSLPVYRCTTGERVSTSQTIPSRAGEGALLEASPQAEHSTRFGLVSLQNYLGRVSVVQ